MGIKKESKSVLYLNALSRTLEGLKTYDDCDKDTVKKIVFYGVKSIITKSKPTTYDEAMHDFQLISVVKGLVGKLTPREFMTIFPINKKFDGDKYQMKDYFSTMESIEEIGMDTVIGEDATEFLYNYDNMSVMLYNVQSLSIMSDIRVFQGKKGIAEEWASENGIEMYKEHTDSNGKKYVMDSKGRTQKVKKPRPKHLKLVK